MPILSKFDPLDAGITPPVVNDSSADGEHLIKQPSVLRMRNPRTPWRLVRPGFFAFSHPSQIQSPYFVKNSLFLTCLLSPFFATVLPAEELQIYVDQAAEKAGDGSFESPFQTLDAARDHLRSLRKETSPVAATISLRAGEYPLRKSFLLTAEDAGSEGFPVVYRTHGDEKVTLSGGVTIGAEDLETVTDQEALTARLKEDVRGKVRKIDLAKIGITLAELASCNTGRAADSSIPWSRGRCLSMAGSSRPPAIPRRRWPEEGRLRSHRESHRERLRAEERSREKSHRRHFRIYRYGSRHLGSIYSDVWLYGYMKETYADGTLKIESVDPKPEPSRWDHRGRAMALGRAGNTFTRTSSISSLSKARATSIRKTRPSISSRPPGSARIPG